MVTLPEWLLIGLLGGVIGSVLVCALFVIAGRLYPGRRPAGSGRRGGEARRRSEIRSYLETIGESYAEDHPVAGQSVAFYLPERDVAITFDARAFYRIDHTDTTPVLVEHEMPGVHLGSRLPFETPTVSFGPPEGPDDDTAVGSAFRELGVGTSPTVPEIKDAYRRRVKEVHPDHGGDEADFRRVREAYTMAKRHAGDSNGR